jgi:hypothetical protein
VNLYCDPGRRYAIRGADPDHRWVEFWSARRLPYDNKRAWEKCLIKDLGERLRRLLEQEGDGDGARWLRAVFASDDSLNCDAGNLTYLNVGTRPFVGLGHRISFERWYEVPEEPCPIGWETGHRYYHRYSLARSPEPERWRPGRTLAMWEGVPCGSLTDEQAARYVWLAMRRHPESIALEPCPDLWSEDYGVSIRVGSPSVRLPAPAGILEAVVDGCLASFHRDSDNEHASRVAAKLATQLNDTDESELLSPLIGAGPLLFAGPPFHQHPTFVQLSPCDDRCQVGSLELVPDVALSRNALSGEIFAIERSAE